MVFQVLVKVLNRAPSAALILPFCQHRFGFPLPVGYFLWQIDVLDREMKLLKIKDNSQQKKESFSQIRNLTGKIADKTLEQLEREGVFVFLEIVREAENITQDQMILQSVNDTYRTSNVMGFIGCGDERLIINLFKVWAVFAWRERILFS